ncbi:MAG TPA: capsid cement protein [Alphaproteobacteria bacterium]|nr:capsid cement protein [Alphaproteobacteria bacterium]
MALSADRNTKFAEPLLESYPVAASTTIYAGSLVCLNSSGYAVPAADTSGYVFVGVAREKIVNSGLDGAKRITVRRKGCFELAYGGTAAITLVGTKVYVEDDQTVNAAASTTNDIPVGYVSQYVDASTVWVDLLTW